jgi:hypothetical protein
MLSRQELTAALAGVRGIVRLDPNAFALFNATHDGFWRSFWAAAILAPFTAIPVAREIIMTPPASMGRFIAFQIIGYVLGWLVFPLLMVRVADMLGRRERYFHYIVALNWFHLIEIVFWGPLLVLGMAGVLPGEIEMLLAVIVMVALLGYEWFIARHTLKIEGGTAAALVAIDLLLSLVIDRLADSLP